MARSKRSSDRGEREGVVCPTLPCAECTRNYLLIHGQRNDPSPIVDSFFKIMLGADFSKLLYLPPQFVPTVSELIGRETELEDASGNRWKVRLSKHDGVVAFRQGWHDFFLEHGIEAGDFVTFYYVKQSHFIVEIYGHNGCRKLNSSVAQDNQKKRKRTCRNSSASGQCHGAHSDLMIRHGSNMSHASGSNVDISESLPLDIDNASNINNGCEKAQSVPSTNFNEEPFYMIDRDVGERERDRWNCLYDLASFEMQKTPAVDEKCKDKLNEKRSLCYIEIMPKSGLEADIVNKIPVAKEAVSSIPVPDDGTGIEKRKDFQMVDTLKLISEKYSGDGDCSGLDQRTKANSSNDQDLISKAENTPLRNTRQRMQRKIADGSELHFLPNSAQTQNLHAGKHSVMKACEKSLNPAIKDGSYVHEVAKPEPVDTSDLLLGPVDASVSPSRVEVKISISRVRGKRSFLELPEPLPSVSSRAKLKADRKLVILLDPQSRQWPMLYQFKFGMSVLTGGWEAFCEANRIRPGDECIFVEENEHDHIYKVSLVQNQE